eukprot:9789-Eustigmatos_ZCMA.PRE.1
MCRGVWPASFVPSTAQPARTSAITAPTCPPAAARCRGLSLSLSHASRSAPASSNSGMMASWPFAAAMCKLVRP